MRAEYERQYVEQQEPSEIAEERFDNRARGAILSSTRTPSKLTAWMADRWK